MKSDQPQRPFRLEREGHTYGVSTFSSREAAFDARDRWAKAKPGKWWKIVERRREKNAQGRGCWRMHVIAEGISVMSIFEIRSLDDSGHIIASEPIEGDDAAWETFRNCERHAAEHGGCFELLKDGVRAAYFYKEKPSREFAVAPDGTTTITERPPER